MMMKKYLGMKLITFVAVCNFEKKRKFLISVKCSIGAVNSLIPTFTAIQYPTTMRTLSVGIGNFAAGLALITVPYLWLLVCISIVFTEYCWWWFINDVSQLQSPTTVFVVSWEFCSLLFFDSIRYRDTDDICILAMILIIKQRTLHFRIEVPIVTPFCNLDSTPYDILKSFVTCYLLDVFAMK